MASNCGSTLAVVQDFLGISRSMIYAVKKDRKQLGYQRLLPLIKIGTPVANVKAIASMNGSLQLVYIIGAMKFHTKLLDS